MGNVITNMMYPISARKLHVTLAKFNEIVALAETVGLSKREIRKFFKVFCEIDVDLSGQISMLEFLNYFKMDNTEFNRRTFLVMDTDKSGKIDLAEFIAAIYNFCTYTHRGLVKYAFELFDEDKSGSLEVFEVIEMVKFIYGKPLDNQITKILENIDKDGSGTISLNEFGASNKKHPILLFPAFHVQEIMRHRVFGVKFWEKHVATRSGDDKELMDKLKEMEQMVQHGRMDALQRKIGHASHGHDDSESDDESEASIGAQVEARTQVGSRARPRHPTRVSARRPPLPPLAPPRGRAADRREEGSALAGRSSSGVYQSSRSDRRYAHQKNRLPPLPSVARIDDNGVWIGLDWVGLAFGLAW